MGFGISMITLLISTITNNFYKKRIESEDTKKSKEEIDFFKKEVMAKLSELENKTPEVTKSYLINKRKLESLRKLNTNLFINT